MLHFDGMGIAETLKARTFLFATAVYRTCAAELQSNRARIVATQLIRASASVAANYRAACRARSRPEFIAKLGVAIEEADESLFWLDFAEATQAIHSSVETQKLRTEANELVAILTASQKTAKHNAQRASGTLRSART
jgi:four helix bundle protein